MSDVSAKVPDNDPLMIAWKAYLETRDYANTLRWAKHFTIVPDTETGQLKATSNHLEGSLWAAFMQGWIARASLGKAADHG